MRSSSGTLGFFIVFCLCLCPSGGLWAAHGLSLDGMLKYGPHFSHFEYAAPQAGKGGELVLHGLGGFDKMNPFTLKGVAPDLLEALVYEPLAETSLDEPFSLYGLLAADLEVAEDGLSLTVRLNKDACFSDGVPLTAEDVVFTVETLKSDLAHPFYPYYYADVDRAEVIDPVTVRFFFKQFNRELPLIAAQMRILPKHVFAGRDFLSRALENPVGSGPYTVESFSQGKSICYQRNPDYWAADHPTRKFMYNFDTICIKYFKDPVVALEAFKAGEFDILPVYSAKQWARDLNGRKIDSGVIIKGVFPHHNNAGMQGFVMNTRRSVFSDPIVRQAIGLAFDFSWTNKALFYGQYVRSDSYFSNSDLAARGLPSKEERALLDQFSSRLPAEVFTTPLKAPETNGADGLRRNLEQAVRLLKSRGWQVREGEMRNEKGETLSFEIMLGSSSLERVMAGFVQNLKKIGVHARYRTVDQALYAERLNAFDFDMCVHSFGQSQSPGNEQRNFWHSSAADRKGSRNLAGVKDPVVDYLVEKIIYASDRAALVSSCQALDRVLWYGYYVVPNWYLNSHRIAYYNKYSFPQTLPKYYDYFSFLMTWWMTP